MSNSINAKEIPKLVNSSPDSLKEGIKDIDLRTLDKNIIEEILKKIDNNSWTIYKLTQVIYILITNPKGGIDINSKSGRDIIIQKFILYSDDIEQIKDLIENYNPNFNAKTYYGTPLGIQLLYDSISYGNIIKTELLLGYIKINNTHGLMGHLYVSFIRSRINDPIQFYRLFLRYGLSIDEVIDDEIMEEVDETEYGYNTLIHSIIDDHKNIFDFCIEQGADVNFIAANNYTPLQAAIYDNFENVNDPDIYYIKKLIEKGANVNYISTSIIDNRLYKNISILHVAIYAECSIEIIKLLLQHGADKDHKETTTNKTALEFAEHRSIPGKKKYYEKLIKLLKGESNEMWKGFSRSDIEKFDIFFDNPFDWSCCPICLEYIERSDACMYMSHDCATTGHFYHEKLYNAYVFNYNGKTKVEWCTVCGRITRLHKHYIVSDSNNPSKTKAPLKPEVQEQIDRGENRVFYDNANCIGFGGGGVEEKAERFRRLREYALELQNDVDKKEYDDVMEKLIEVVWDSALVKSEKVKKILEDKKWNISVNVFPEDKRSTRRNNNNNNSNAANQPFGGRKPTVKEGGDCIIYADDEEGEASNPTYQFHHETVGGIDHDGIYICQKDLAEAVQIKCKEFGLEDFGKCWFSQCKGILHPEELKGIVPELLYEEYRKKFNKKMVKKGGGRTRKLKKQRGGNVKSVLHELKDGVCSSYKIKTKK